jgi:hypothetical protein
MYLSLIISLVCINSLHFFFHIQERNPPCRTLSKRGLSTPEEGFLIATTFHNIMIARSKLSVFVL